MTLTDVDKPEPAGTVTTVVVCSHPPIPTDDNGTIVAICPPTNTSAWSGPKFVPVTVI